MSHVVDCDIVIKDLDAFEEACEAIGLEFRRDQKTYKWYGKWVNDYSAENAAYIRAGVKPEDYGKCEHAAAVKGNASAYELGLVPNPKGEGYVLIFDFYGGNGRALQNAIGKEGNKLKIEYSQRVIEKVAEKKGFKLKAKKRIGKKDVWTLSKKI